MISSQGLVLATAMAVSGTVILHALRFQKSFSASQFPFHENSQSSKPILRSCISSDGKRGEKKKKMKRVHFADDVVDSCGGGEEFLRQQHMSRNYSSYSNSKSKVQNNFNDRTDMKGMPANRVALYNGILRDRVAQRLAYSY